MLSKKSEKIEKNTTSDKIIDTCTKHNKSPYNYICVSPPCKFFAPLCDFCLEEHKIVHEKEYEDLHPAIRRLPELRQELDKTIKESEVILEELIKETHALYTAKDETILNQINKELDEIQTSMKEHFDSLKKEIKKTFEDKLREINNEISKFYYDLRHALEFCFKYVDKPITLDVIKTIYSLDLRYQVAYKQEKKDILTEKKNNMRFDAEISKEYRDKFFANFDMALNELVAYENSPYIRLQNIEMSSITDKGNYLQVKRKNFVPNNKEENCFEVQDLSSNENNRRWMFYFEENTKNFYYIDTLRLKSRMFEKIVLSIPFSIFPNHRSHMASDGEIYLLGGYNIFINENNEQEYLNLYKLDVSAKTLIPMEKMNTLRHSFGMCSVKNKIFVVGGSNYREGSLIKCENYDLKTRKWTKNNFLNIRSSNHSLAVYKDTYIFKIGGLRKNFTNVKEVSFDIFERYNIGLDLWEMMKLKDNNPNSPVVSYMNGCFLINENNILVFGGKNERSEIVKQTFLINFSRNDMNAFSDKADENYFTIMETNTKTLPFGVYFTSSMAVISGKILYVCGFATERDRKVLTFDQKGWKNL